MRRRAASEIPSREVKVITGRNNRQLRQYVVTEKAAKEKRLHLPQVLILTYRIAEAGVNLPAYNYEVNYHMFAVGDGINVSNEHSLLSRFSDLFIFFKLTAGYLDGVKSAVGKICYLRCFKVPGTLPPFPLIVAVYSLGQVWMGQKAESGALFMEIINSTGIIDPIKNLIVNFIMGKLFYCACIPACQALPETAKATIKDLSDRGETWARHERSGGSNGLRTMIFFKIWMPGPRFI